MDHVSSVEEVNVVREADARISDHLKLRDAINDSIANSRRSQRKANASDRRRDQRRRHQHIIN